MCRVQSQITIILSQRSDQKYRNTFINDEDQTVPKSRAQICIQTK